MRETLEILWEVLFLFFGFSAALLVGLFLLLGWVAVMAGLWSIVKDVWEGRHEL